MRELPLIRHDIVIESSQMTNETGSYFLVFDPLKNQYYRIDDMTMMVLRYWSLGQVEAILKAIKEKENLNLTKAHIDEVLKFLFHNELIVAETDEYIDMLINKQQRKKSKSVSQLLMSILMIKIPLLRADRFLQQSQKLCKVFFKPQYWWFFLLLSLFAVVSILPQTGALWQQVENITSLQGMVSLVVAMIFLKMIHELGHAYVAKHYGCEVSGFGVAFILFFPILYTDTVAAWKLDDSKKRLMIDLAGIIAEVNCVVWCMIWWQVVDSAILKQGLAYVITVGLVSSLLINANPLMRFDGYYALSSFLNVDNLQETSFSLARWQLRKIFLGDESEKPYHLDAFKQRLIIFYAFFTWIYRFFLFIGIAVFVYYCVFKLLGIILFVLEIVLLVLRPILSELSYYAHHILKRPMNVAKIKLFSLLAIIIFVLVFPWSSTITVPAVMVFQYKQDIYTQTPGRIIHLVAQDQTVAKDELLLQLASPDLIYEKGKATIDIDFIQNKILQQKKNKTSNYSELDETDLDKAKQHYQHIMEEITAQRVKAPFAGQVVNVTQYLQTEQWVNQSQRLFSLVQSGHFHVQAYLPEYELDRIRFIKDAWFISNSVGLPLIPLVFKNKGQVSVESLSRPYLASVYGGPISVYESRQPTQSYEVKDSYFPLYFNVKGPVILPFEQRGIVFATVKKQSILARVYQKVVALIIRESSF